MVTYSRRTGKTTACALSIISRAISSPTDPVPIQDLSVGKDLRYNWQYQQFFVHCIQDCIAKLGLINMVIDRDSKNYRDAGLNGFTLTFKGL